MDEYYASPELYDLIYSGFQADVGYVVRLASAARGPVLEVACGSGRLLLPMLEAGADADGLDLSRDMLGAARKKVAAKGLRSTLVEGDMRDFTMTRRYAWILIAFNSFYHNMTQADQIDTLRCCREHLLEGGSLTVIAFHPSVAILATADGAPKLTIEHARPGGAGRVRVWDTMSPDTVTQRNEIARRIELLDPAGKVERTIEVEFALRYCYAPEMELLFRAAGFGRWEACTPFDKYQDAAPLETPAPPRPGGTLAWRAWKS